MEIEVETEKDGSKASKMPDKYEVEDALRTLMRACEVQDNPKLMAEVRKLASKQKKAISSIAELKAVASEKLSAKDEE